MQALPKKILVATDFSAASRAALQQAALTAKACDAKLTVIYADQFVPPLDPKDELPDRTKRDADIAVKLLDDEVRAVVPANVNVETMIVVDKPADAILDVAKKQDVDWIVMGTHGRTGFRRFILGSVAEEVLRHADRPVMTIHAA